jgi:hypothetical protein
MLPLLVVFYKVEMVGTEEPDLRLLKTNISPSHSFLTSFPLVRYGTGNYSLNMRIKTCVIASLVFLCTALEIENFIGPYEMASSR